MWYDGIIKMYTLNQGDTAYWIKRRLVFWSNVLVAGSDDCWEWQGSRDAKGYGVFWFISRPVGSHRFSYIDNIERCLSPDLNVLHRCDNPPCVNFGHLFSGTHKDNCNDAIARGQLKNPFLPGEQHHNAKLTWEQVREIRKRHLVGGCSYRSLAREFGIAPVNIRAVVLNLQWKEPNS